MLEIIFAKLVSAIRRTNLFLFELLQLIQDLLHALDSRLMLVIIPKHLEDNLPEGQSVLLRFE